MVKRPNKNLCMALHFLKRFKQRFNVSLTADDYASIVSSIKKRKANAKFLYKHTCTKSIYSIDYNGISFGVVYNNQRKHLHTCFPLSWISNNFASEEIYD